MNLRLLLGVIGRFKYVVLAGAVVAVAASTLAAARVSFDGPVPRLEHRGHETWRSTATLLVTQQGFPWGRSTLDDVVPIGPDGDAGYARKFADTGRFQGLAMLYTQFAEGDAVRQLILRDGPIHGAYGAEVVRQPGDGTPLPLIAIRAYASSPDQAQAIGRRVVDAFIAYLHETQAANDIPEESRVQVEVVEQPHQATLYEARKMTKPIFLFVLMMTGVIVLTFALDNLRPRPPLSGTGAAVRPVPLPEGERKSA